MIQRMPPAPETDASGRLTRAERAVASKRAKARRHYERARSRDARRSRRSGFGVLGLAAAAAGLAASGSLGGALLGEWLGEAPLERVRVVGAERLGGLALVAHAGLAQAPAAATLDADALGEALAAHPWVESARVHRLPAPALVVSVVERTPAALVATKPASASDSASDSAPDSTGWALVDAEGLEIELAPPDQVAAGGEWSELPRLHGDALTDPAARRNGIALARALREIGLGKPELAYRAADDEGWVVQGDAPDRAATPVELWLGSGAPDAIVRLGELLAGAEDLGALAGSPVTPITSSDSDGSEKSAAAAENRVRIDLRFAGRAIVSRSDFPSPADV